MILITAAFHGGIFDEKPARWLYDGVAAVVSQPVFGFHSCKASVLSSLHSTGFMQMYAITAWTSLWSCCFMGTAIGSIITLLYVTQTMTSAS